MSSLLAAAHRRNAGGFVPSGMDVWLESDLDVLNHALTPAVDNDPVRWWNDLSGNGNDAGNSSSGGSPIFKTGVLNGLPVLRFAMDSLVVASFSGAQPSTVFVVGAVTDSGTNGGFVDGLSFGTQLLFRHNNDNLHMYAGSFGPTYNSFPSSTFVVASCIFDGASSALRIDGGGLLTGDVGAGDAGGLTIGQAGGGSFELNGDIAAVLYYSGVLSTTDREDVEDYLGAKYGISITH